MLYSITALFKVSRVHLANNLARAKSDGRQMYPILSDYLFGYVLYLVQYVPLTGPGTNGAVYHKRRHVNRF